MTARRTEPSWSLLQQPQRYVSAAQTDIKATFARIKAEQEQPVRNVTTLPPRRSAK